MSEALTLLIFTSLGFLCGHFHGYAKAMHYCTKRIEELWP